MSEDFHATLQALQSRRDEIERDFDELLETLDGRVAAARAALEHAAGRAEASAGEIAESTAAGAADFGDDAPAEAPGGLLSRLLGGRLERMEHRQRALELQMRALALGHGEATGHHREHVESVRELAGRATEAAEAAALAVRRMRDLLNAKEAETVHVATHGARAQTELTLHELARQQEALLAELVGRRRELDDLVESVRASEKD